MWKFAIASLVRSGDAMTEATPTSAYSTTTLKEAELATLKAENAALRDQIYVLQGELLLARASGEPVANQTEQAWWDKRELEPPK